MVERYRSKRKALIPVTGNEPVRKKNKQSELPCRGRKPGSPNNKYTAKMRDLILEAAAGVGCDGEGKDGVLGYLKRCAEEERVAFLNALVKLVPPKLHAQIDASATIEHVEYETVEEAKDALAAEGIIIDQVLE
jgi:hypothetical protein